MPTATADPTVDNFLTPEMIRVRLGFANKRQVYELISPESYGKAGPPSLAAVNIKQPGGQKNRWCVRESELNRYIASLETNA